MSISLCANAWRHANRKGLRASSRISPSDIHLRTLNSNFPTRNASWFLLPDSSWVLFLCTIVPYQSKHDVLIVLVANVQRGFESKTSHSKVRDAPMRRASSQSGQIDGHDIWPVIWLAAVGAFPQPVGEACFRTLFAKDVVAGPEHGVLRIQLANGTESDLLHCVSVVGQ